MQRNRMRVIGLLLLVLVASFSTAGCSSLPRPTEAPFLETNPKEGVTASPLGILITSTGAISSTPTPTVSPFPFTRVFAGELDFAIYWSGDSSTLYFRGDSWKGLILETGVITDLEANAPDLLTAIAPTTPSLPQMSHAFGFSPSGERGLFVLRLEPSPTPEPPSGTPGDLGVVFPPKVPSELLLWERGETRRIGSIEDCVRGIYLWSHNEQKVIVYAVPNIPCEIASWFVDVVSGELQVLVSRNESPPNPFLYAWYIGFSPDDSWVLVLANGKLWKLDTVSLQFSVIEPGVNYYINNAIWLSEETLLVEYENERFDPQPNRLGVMNLETKEIYEILDPKKIDEFHNLPFFIYRFSSDGKWIVVLAGRDLLHLSELWYGTIEDLLIFSGYP